MKLAEAKYVGPMRSHIRRGPSGEKYHFKKPVSGPRPLPVSSLKDANALAQNDVFEVEWTAYGEIVKNAGGHVEDASSLLKDLSYRQKQKLVTALGLEVKGNAKESKLESALEPAVEEMVQNLNTK